MDKIYDIIFYALNEVNRLRSSASQIPEKTDVCLYGSNSYLDSLEFVNLMVTIEQRIENDFRITISLTGPELKLSDKNPFRTVETLHHYVAGILNSHGISVKW
jgi:hypothetical protein